MLLKLGYRPPETENMSRGEIQGILKSYERLNELASGKPGKTYKIKLKKK